MIYGEKMETIKPDPVLSVEYVLFLTGYVDASVAGGSAGESSTALKWSYQSGFSWHVLFVWIFVPIGLLASGVRKIAQFLPGLLVHKGE